METVYYGLAIRSNGHPAKKILKLRFGLLRTITELKILFLQHQNCPADRFMVQMVKSCSWKKKLTALKHSYIGLASDILEAACRRLHPEQQREFKPLICNIADKMNKKYRGNSSLYGNMKYQMNLFWYKILQIRQKMQESQESKNKREGNRIQYTIQHVLYRWS